jgi:2-polyprenyl-6-methoxyphenol hydroxylase-like FAD-dependent oxidoreductase
MAEASDVVIVGAGIAGASLAYALASQGMGVTMLEASLEYQDRVRGESMQVWGVKEARNIGVEQVLLDAGAHVAPVWKQYGEGVGETGEIPMWMMAEGVAGSLNIRHPDACQALMDAARGVGARVIRGVKEVKLNVGSPVTVTYASPNVGEVSAPLVIGADGRNSSVRRQIGITLERQDPVTYIAGLLVEGLHGVPDDFDVVASEGDLFILMFHQGGGRARLYLCPGVSGRHRFSGPEGTKRFLAAWNPACYPFSEVVSSAVPVGPCATYPGDDTWTATPFAQGVVLIGDAAGYNDPIIGQGLSISMRDARIVRDLVLDGARQPAEFTPYAEERVERMRRLRLIADVVSATEAEDADNRQARRAFMAERFAAMDPEVFPLLVGPFAGPETVPDELFDGSILDRIRNAKLA